MGMNLDEKFQANAGGEYISVWLKGDWCALSEKCARQELPLLGHFSNNSYEGSTVQTDMT